MQGLMGTSLAREVMSIPLSDEVCDDRFVRPFTNDGVYTVKVAIRAPLIGQRMWTTQKMPLVLMPSLKNAEKLFGLLTVSQRLNIFYGGHAKIFFLLETI